MNAHADTTRGTVLSPTASAAPDSTMAVDASASGPSARPALAGLALVVVLVMRAREQKNGRT